MSAAEHYAETRLVRFRVLQQSLRHCNPLAHRPPAPGQMIRSLDFRPKTWFETEGTSDAGEEMQLKPPSRSDASTGLSPKPD